MTQRIRFSPPQALILTASIGLLLALHAPAEERAAAPPPGGPPSAEAAKPGAEKDKEGPKRFPDFNEVVKDMKPIEGLFTLYRYDPSDKARDPEKLLCKIPAGLLNEDMLFATSLSRAGSLTGWMWSDYLVRWEVVGNQLKLVVPDTRNIPQEDKPVAEAVRRTYNEGFIAAVPILSMTPGGDVLIDLGPLLKSNIADVPLLGANIRPELSKWTKVKCFPENVLIEVSLAVGSPRGGDGREIGVAYAFQKLPRLGAYKPRRADQRVGYFLTTRIDWAKPTDARETAERYINRWHLEKRDESLELSPPKKPIVFIIEKTVPVQWRRYIREGIEAWNQAFEKIGLVDAVVVQQQTDDNEYKDYDPEDARYNFFRWTVTGNALAVGPSRADPRTGQILDADIVMDEAWVRHFVYNFDVFTSPTAIINIKGPGFVQYLRQYPTLVPDLLKPPTVEILDPQLALRRQMEDYAAAKLYPAAGCNGQSCSYAEGMVEQLALAHYAMVATGTGKKVPERLIGEALKEVAAHEVGHTLGLRHNFKGSAWLSLDEVRARRDRDEPTVASVMDYNPLLFFADDDLAKVRHFMTPCIGPYDEWAIEYGYAFPAKGQSEEDLLKSVAARSTQPGLAFATDEDTFGVYSPDPWSNRYDMGADPLAWARTRVELINKLQSNVLDWSIREGEPRYFATQAFNVLMSQKARNFQYVGRLIGGQQFHRHHKGDPDARPAFELVDARQQREALKFLNETLFRDDFFRVEPDVLNNLAPSRWLDLSSFSPAMLRLDYPIHDRIAAMQLITLVDVTSPPVLQRIYDAELKSTDPDKFTAAELIRTLRDAIWAPLDRAPAAEFTDAKPMISSVSRNLQRQYLNIMLAAAQLRPGEGLSADLNGMIRFALRELSEKIDATLKKGKLDFATRAHLAESKSRIDRVLEAEFSAN